MNPERAFTQAIELLDKLHFSRTGRSYLGPQASDSDESRRGLLKRRICEERILLVFREVLHIQMRKRLREHFSVDMTKLSPAEISDAVVETAQLFLTYPELDTLRRDHHAADEGAYYHIETNEKFPSDEEDLFATVQKMQRRITCDSNTPLPDPLNSHYAFILGQTLDHEGDFWLRAQVKRGNENLFSFGVTNYQDCFRCLEIRRLRNEMMRAINKRKARIPDACQHYSCISRLEEIKSIIRHYIVGKERLIKGISDLKTYYRPGSYQMGCYIARRCAALLLHEDSSELKFKTAEEWSKFLSNDHNALGDTLLIHNALYFNAEILTKDKGVKRMAEYCGLHCIEAVVS